MSSGVSDDEYRDKGETPWVQTNLIATGTLIMAQTALPLNVAVGQERVVSRAVRLGRLALLDVAVVPQTDENVLDDRGVLIRRGAAKDVELKAEPVVDIFVDRVILGA